MSTFPLAAEIGCSKVLAALLYLILTPSRLMRSGVEVQVFEVRGRCAGRLPELVTNRSVWQTAAHSSNDGYRRFTSFRQRRQCFRGPGDRSDAIGTESAEPAARGQRTRCAEVNKSVVTQEEE
jgi:hypothetical protein